MQNSSAGRIQTRAEKIRQIEELLPIADGRKLTIILAFVRSIVRE